MVSTAFRAHGHEAFSCDIMDCSGGHPEWHIKGDCIPLLDGNCVFQTVDGKFHTQDGKWDLVIAHPPCTFLTVAGAANIPKHPERIDLGFQAKEFFLKCLNADCDMVAVENPPPMKRFGLPPYTQIVRPWQHGHNNNKAICLWLKGLPPIVPTNLIDYIPETVTWVYSKTGERKSCSRWYNTDTRNHSKARSKTFSGIAIAFAEQWGTLRD